MIVKKKLVSYNDGIIGVYSEIYNKTDFNAKTNSKTLSDFTFVMNLCFSEENKRQEDLLFAEAMNRKLTLKLKTPLVAGVDNHHKVILNNFIYDIIKLDPDKKNKELYFYLEGVRVVEE